MFQLLEVSEVGAILTQNGACLEVQLPKCESPLRRIPFEELDVLLLSQSALTLTGGALAELGRARVAVVCCNRTCLPVSCMLPMFVDSTSHYANLMAQMAMSQPQRKRLWQALIRAKVAGQAAVLRRFRNSDALRGAAAMVQSGDASGEEARAAALYWRTLALFPKRCREADDDNRLFNYLYTILYAAVARQLCAHGISPQLGLHHENRYNAFRLASDIMEPFRPAADSAILQFIGVHEPPRMLDSGSKRALCALAFAQRLRVGEQSFALFDAIRQTVCSYRKILETGKGTLQLPIW